MTNTLAREIESIQAFRETDCARTGIRAMQQVGWTVDAPWSNVASRPQQRAPRPDLSGGTGRYGRANARATETDTGNPAFLGRHAGRRAAPAALRCLRQCLFPAPTILPSLRLPQGQPGPGQRQGHTLQLRY